MPRFLRILHFLSIPRISNLFMLYFSYGLSLILRKAVVWNKPFAITIEPNNYCNFNCPQCPTGLGISGRPKGDIPVDLFRKLITETHRHTFWLNLYFQGEPLLHPQLAELIAIAKAKKFYVSVSTNGSLLNPGLADKLLESGLDEVIISIDGSNEESYSRYRKGGNFREIIENTRLLAEAKKRKKTALFIILQSLIFQHNEKEIKEIKKLGKELGVDKTELKTAQFYSFDNSALQPPVKEKYSRYESDDKHGFRLKKTRGTRGCLRLWSTAVVTHTGELIACCYDKDNAFIMGNVNMQPLRNSWKGKRYNDFRKEILQNRYRIEICRNCNL